MTALDNLTAKVAAAEAELVRCKAALSEALAAPEQHVYESHEAAEEDLHEFLYAQAVEACEGRHNCGLEAYTQAYIVDSVVYMAKMTFEYNRHDKTYYYVEEAAYSYASA